MQEWSQEGEKLSFMDEQNITHSQTKLGDIAPEQTIIYRQLLAGHVVGCRPIKRKKNPQCSIDSTVCHVYVKGWKNASQIIIG